MIRTLDPRFADGYCAASPRPTHHFPVFRVPRQYAILRTINSQRDALALQPSQAWIAVT